MVSQKPGFQGARVRNREKPSFLETKQKQGRKPTQKGQTTRDQGCKSNKQHLIIMQLHPSCSNKSHDRGWVSTPVSSPVSQKPGFHRFPHRASGKPRAGNRGKPTLETLYNIPTKEGQKDRESSPKPKYLRMVYALRKWVQSTTTSTQ